MVGGGGKPGAGDISELPAKALESARNELSDVGDLLERLGDEIDDVNITRADSRAPCFGTVRWSHPQSRNDLQNAVHQIEEGVQTFID